MHKAHSWRWRPFLARRLIVLTVVTAGAAALARFADEHWTLELLSHFTRHYFYAGLLFAGLLFWLGRPRWALLAGVLAMSQMPLLDGYPGVPARPCSHGSAVSELRVLQFNVGRRNRKAAAFYPWLKERGGLPDILILFEATSRLEERLRDLGLAGFERQLVEFRDDNYGIAVASRLEDVQMRLEPIGDPYLPSVLIRGRTHGVPFTLVATHPPPPLTADLASARNRQFAALAGFMADVRGPNRILVGDLNVTPWSPWFGRLLDEAGLRSARHDREHLGTFPAFGLPSFLALPIDHTLVSPQVRVLSRTVGPGISLGSDHRLIETTLALCSH